MSETIGSHYASQRRRSLDESAVPASTVSFDASAPRGFDHDFSLASARDAVLSNLEIQVRGALEEVALEWKAFEARADCTPFQTFAWIEKWQRNIGARRATVPVIVLGRDKAGEILFILPLAIETNQGLRRLTWLGWELGDYNAPLLSPGFAKHPATKDFAAVWKGVVQLLLSDPRFQFDLIDLPKMPKTVGRQDNPFLSLATVPNRSGAYVTTLAGDWEAYYAAKRSSATRKTARKKQRQLEENGVVQLVEIQHPADAERTLDALVSQKSRFFARLGVENIFERPGYRDFYLDLTTDPKTRDFVHMSRLEVGPTIAATNVGLQFGGCYYLILSSYYDGDLARFGPGRIHLQELLQRAITRGFGYFDFTIGDEPYKLDWAETKLTLYDHLAAVTARGWLVMSGTMLSRWMLRFIKQTPILWRAASRARALSGRLSPAKIDGRE
jgi:CelD/BcsL family acetyltransferase involved in cellulose biosynthesis